MIIDAKLGGKLKRFAKKYGIADKDMEAFMKRVAKEPGFYERPEHKNISKAPPVEEVVRRGAEVERGMAERRTAPFRRGRAGGMELVPIPANEGAPRAAPVLAPRAAPAPRVLPAAAPAFAVAPGDRLNRSDRLRMGWAVARARGIDIGQALRAVDGGERIEGAIAGASPHATKKASVAERKAESARMKAEAEVAKKERIIGRGNLEAMRAEDKPGMGNKFIPHSKVVTEGLHTKLAKKTVEDVMGGMVNEIVKANPVKRGRKPKAEVE